MSDIFWLVSYPKSGNTWLRALLTNYLRDADKPADINSLDGGPIASARIWFDEWAGVEASTLDDTVVERLRPGVYRCIKRFEKETFYMKTHDAWKRTDRGEPLFPADVTSGVVYIVRNPLDLAASCANHWGVDLDIAVENLCAPTFSIANSIGGTSDQLRQFLGSWSHHVRSWLDESDLSPLVVRYEDMVYDTDWEFGGIVRFLGLPANSDRISKSVRFSRFDELRRQESTNGFRERPLKTSTFFRCGCPGSWRRELTQDHVARLIDVHGETMRRFGYLD